MLLGALVNVFRSTPFIILLVALPFTRVLIGTTIGVWAARAAVDRRDPFFARIAEVSLREVDRGLIEAALAMGAKRRHIVWHVLLPEALPGMLGGFTITVVALIGSTAMAAPSARRPRRSGDPLWLPAFRHHRHGDRDRDPDRARLGRANHGRPPGPTRDPAYLSDATSVRSLHS